MTAPGGMLAEGVLVQAMHLYSGLVFQPYASGRAAGLIPRTTAGDVRRPCRPARPRPAFLAAATPARSSSAGRPTNDPLVSEFDRMGEIYDAYVRPFSTPLMDAAVDEMRPWIRPDARLLDAGCGAGRELCRLSRLVPEGEVVGIDLAAGMVNAAHKSARAKGFDNTAFFQADVGDLPAEFSGAFDLVYSSLAHHHYPDPPAATAEIYRALRPGGYYAVIDAGPDWFVKRSSALAHWADPGWIGFHTPSEFMALFSAAGFHNVGWIDLLPGFGIACAQKPLQEQTATIGTSSSAS